jgi:hypothetical protein
MGLDFVVLGEGNRAQRIVSLSRTEHARFTRRVQSGYFPILNRLTDYLADEEFVPAELPALRDSFLASQEQVDARDSDKMKEMISLIEFAIENGKEIRIIAD